ncbi:MAG: methyltransferase domain-containing protein [Sedimentisphaerales bacterium]|nr:methyltransferase domain-containing protein [Sedimentisphaerales bacterium]
MLKTESKMDLGVLCCPTCNTSVHLRDETRISCNSCHVSYPVRDQVPIMLDAESDRMFQNEEKECKGAELKKRSRGWIAYLYRILKAPSPTLIKKNIQHVIDLVHKDNPRAIILEIGSGHHQRNDVINLDIQMNREVDIVADAHKLPFASQSVDGIIAATLMEHVQNPGVILTEMKRVLKPGGYIYISMPFCYPYHEAPSDYWRASIKGLRYLCKDFEQVATGTEMGPASVFSVFLRAFLATLFSLGRYPIYRVLLEVFGWVTFPLKYLDLILHGYGPSDMDGVVYYIGRSKGMGK